MSGGRIYGYARVSARDQDPGLQVDALQRAHCDEIIQETASGVRDRPALAALVSRLGSGDTLVAWKLDRLGRSASQVLALLDDLRSRGVVFRSITEGLDTSTPFGRLGVTILAAVAEMERDVLLERIGAGIERSRAAGRHGRPRTWDADQVRHARTLIDQGTSLRQAARLVGLPRSTLADALVRMASPSAV